MVTSSNGKKIQRHWRFVRGIPPTSVDSSPKNSDFDAFFDLRMNQRLSTQARRR